MAQNNVSAHFCCQGTPLAHGLFVNIRFTSSLTPDDENMLAPALLNAMSRILDLLPIAYMIRIDTCDSQVYQHDGSGKHTDPVVANYGLPTNTAPFDA